MLSVPTAVKIQTSAGIFKQSMGASNRVGIGLSYRAARLHRLAKFIPWNRFLGFINVQKYGLRLHAQPGGIDSLELILWLFKIIKIRAQRPWDWNWFLHAPIPTSQQKFPIKRIIVNTFRHENQCLAGLFFLLWFWKICCISTSTVLWSFPFFV